MEKIEKVGGSEAIFHLISIVRQDPGIWDRTSTLYITQYDTKIRRFANIAAHLNLENITAEILRAAWRELSEKYRRRLYDGKRRNSATNWPYFEAMSFMRDQYEQTKWYHPLPVAQSSDMPSSSSTANLVDNFLNSPVILNTEQTVSKSIEHHVTYSCATVQQQRDGTNHTYYHGSERSNEYAVKYESVDQAPQPLTTSGRFHMCGNCPKNDQNLDVATMPSFGTDSIRSVEQYDNKQFISPFMSAEGSLQSNDAHGQVSPGIRARSRSQRYEAYSCPHKIWKQQKLPIYQACVRQVNTSEESVPKCSANSNRQILHVKQQKLPCDTVTGWENIGRVWIDMMKTIRSPQLALATNKYIMNTLFTALEADQRLVGADPNTINIQIRDDAPHIEITMHQ